MSDHRLPPDRCPHCNSLISAAGNAPGEEGAPSPGDTTVCMYCARVCKFDESLRLRKPTDEELAEAFSDENVWNTIRAVKIAGPRRPMRNT